MEVAEIDNDTRGWIMCIVSGIACMIGSSIICVDTFVRLLPGKKNFRIQDSNAFLAGSLSLSFGVMIFMSLFSMLPESKDYLKKGDIPDQTAGFILMGSFVGGFVGIQILSRLFHQLIPSHVVDCDHSHDDHHGLENHSHTNGFGGQRQSSHAHSIGTLGRHHSTVHTHIHTPKPDEVENGHANEATPLLSREISNQARQPRPLKRAETVGPTHAAPPASIRRTRSRAATERRPSVLQTRVISFVKDTKPNCDESGPCFGYSDPCGQECFKHLSRSGTLPRSPTTLRTTTVGHGETCIDTVDEDGDYDHSAPVSPTRRTSRAHSRDVHFQQPEDECDSDDSEDLEAQHHHHVAKNAFLSIGLQTSVAIALHKFPEGFVTYATNHANPALGFNVFLALFVHNLSEGFALALPLYMALHSKLRAILWSSLLGGLSQPFGAAVAVLWFKLAQHTNITPDAVAYGCLFAITAGIMTSVALQLFVESLSLNHNKNLSILFAFLGMTLLGVSTAFTAHAH